MITRSQPSDWIYVFDIETDLVRTEGPRHSGEPRDRHRCTTLSRAAFEVAPAKAVEHGRGIDAVVSTIVRRLSAYLPSIAN